MADPADGDLVIGLTGAKRHWWLAGLALLALFATLAAIAAITEPAENSIFQTVLMVGWWIMLWLRFRAVRADRNGIRRRQTLRITSWAGIERIIEPGRWDASVHLRTTAGKDLPTGLPAAYVEQLATLSGKPVERRLSAAAKPPTKEQRDLCERAARVKARNCELMGDDNQT